MSEIDSLDFRQKGKLVIGLSGSIASGKSTALEIFSKAGVEVISADILAKKQRQKMQDKIKDFFGTTNNQEIANVIFADITKKKWLENSLHPLILQEAKEIIKNSSKKIIVFEVPLLFEKGLEGGFDLTICLTASYKKRKARAIARGLRENDFLVRDKAQMSVEQKVCKADLLIYNDTTQKDLEEKILRFIKVLNK